MTKNVLMVVLGVSEKSGVTFFFFNGTHVLNCEFNRDGVIFFVKFSDLTMFESYLFLLERFFDILYLFH